MTARALEEEKLINLSILNGNLIIHARDVVFNRVTSDNVIICINGTDGFFDIAKYRQSNRTYRTAFTMCRPSWFFAEGTAHQQYNCQNAE